MYMPRGRPHSCPYCNSTKTICKGWRITKYQGKRRIKLCKACGRKFTPKNQKPVELTVNKVVEVNAKPNEAPTAGVVAEVAVEPANDSKPLLNALDEEWTS
jgi:transcriptional regulator NrdR family protein